MYPETIAIRENVEIRERWASPLHRIFCLILGQNTEGSCSGYRWISILFQLFRCFVHSALFFVGLGCISFKNNNILVC